MTPSAYRLPAPLGTLVYRAGLAGESDVQDALSFAERHGRRLGEVLLQRGLVTERDLTSLLADQRGLASVSLADQTIDPDAASLLSEDDCRAHLVFPFRFQDGRVVLAVGDPANDAIFEEFKTLAGRETVFVAASRTEIYAAIEAHFQNRPRSIGQPGGATTAIAGELRPASEPTPPEAVSPSSPEPVPPLAPVEVAVPLAGPRAFEPAAAEAPTAEAPAPSGNETPPARPELDASLSPRLRVDGASPLGEPAEPAPAAPAGEAERSERVEHVEVTVEAQAVEPAPIEPVEPVAVEPAASEPDAIVAESVEFPRHVRRDWDESDVRFRPVALDFDGVPSSDAAPGSQVSPAPSTAPRRVTNDVPAPSGPASGANGQPSDAALFRIVLHLDGGETLDLDTFADEAGALSAAAGLATELASMHTWFGVGRFFVQPSRILALEVQETHDERPRAQGRFARVNGSDAAPPGASLR